MRLRAFSLVIFALAAMLPSHSSAQTAVAPVSNCHELVVPADLSSGDIEALAIASILCPGQQLRVETKRSTTDIKTPEFKSHEVSTDEKVVLPRTPTTEATTPEAIERVDLEELARLTGSEIKEKNRSVVIKGGGSTYERTEEKTSIDGDDFSYDNRETKEEIDQPGLHSETSDSKEEFRANG